MVRSGFAAEHEEVLDDGALEDPLLATPLGAGLLETQVDLAETLASLVGLDDARPSVAHVYGFPLLLPGRVGAGRDAALYGCQLYSIPIWFFGGSTSTCIEPTAPL